MARIKSGNAKLKPMTVKIDPELKSAVAYLAKGERRTASASAAVLIQYGLLKWIEAGDLQRLISEVDKGWSKTAGVRRDLQNR